MINTLFKSFLFLLSYLPLFIIFAINNFGNFLFLFFSIFSIFVFVVSSVLFLSAKKNSEEKCIPFEKVESENVRLLDYIFVYILPFISFGGIKELISFALIVFIVGNIYVKTDLIAINPV
ncbi:MAG TPA: hypothetical protein DEA49_00065, partial [Petrotoga sp.]|nr:hypothetical protein [Petrotoga sp.]